MSEDEIERGMETEEAEDATLDERPRPVRKAGSETFAELDSTAQTKRKGTRKVK
jgi:hypothetical protein